MLDQKIDPIGYAQGALDMWKSKLSDKQTKPGSKAAATCERQIKMIERHIKETSVCEGDES